MQNIFRIISYNFLSNFYYHVPLRFVNSSPSIKSRYRDNNLNLFLAHHLAHWSIYIPKKRDYQLRSRMRSKKIWLAVKKQYRYLASWRQLVVQKTFNQWTLDRTKEAVVLDWKGREIFKEDGFETNSGWLAKSRRPKLKRRSIQCPIKVSFGQVAIRSFNFQLPLFLNFLVFVSLIRFFISSFFVPSSFMFVTLHSLIVFISKRNI